VEVGRSGTIAGVIPTQLAERHDTGAERMPQLPPPQVVPCCLHTARAPMCSHIADRHVLMAQPAPHSMMHSQGITSQSCTHL
jgi:hypothetical protein